MSTKKRIKETLLSLVNDFKIKGKATYNTNVSRITRETLDIIGKGRAVIGLNSSGCTYQKETGGCYHCGHLEGYKNSQDLFKQFISDVNSFDNMNEIYVYSNGSFFDDEEIASTTRINILEHLVEKGFKRVIVESRPEFVNENKFKRLSSTLQKIKLYIGLGFDTYDDKIRDVSLNKGFSREVYDNATEVLMSRKIGFETRVVVKPPFLTEQEGINQAIKTVEHAFKRGTDTVSLEPIALQNYTLQDYLNKKGEYHVPWLWSIISIINATHRIGRIVVGGESFVPLPYETAHNCDKCTSEVKHAITEFNQYQQIEIFGELECDCRKNWKHSLDEKSEKLYDRILRVI